MKKKYDLVARCRKIIELKKIEKEIMNKSVFLKNGLEVHIDIYEKILKPLGF